MTEPMHSPSSLGAAEPDTQWRLTSRAVLVIQLVIWIWSAVKGRSDETLVQIASWVVPIGGFGLAWYALLRLAEKESRRLTNIEAVALGTIGWLSFFPAAAGMEAPWSLFTMFWWLILVLTLSTFLRFQRVPERAEVLRSWWLRFAGMLGGLAAVLFVAGLLWAMSADDGERFAAKGDQPPHSPGTVEDKDGEHDGKDLGGNSKTPSAKEGAGATTTTLPLGDDPDETDSSEAEIGDGRSRADGSDGDATGTKVLDEQVDASCTSTIGAWAPGTVEDKAITDRVMSLVADLVDWDLCADGPISVLAIGLYRQSVRSSLAGPSGWLIGYYGNDGEPTADFIPPQVGQVYAQQPAMADWLMSGFPHRDSKCGRGRVQIFWNPDGVVTGFAYWRYAPNPTDSRAMSAWFVPASVGRGLIAFEAAHDGTLPFAVAPASDDDPPTQSFEDDLLIQGADGLLLASEILRLCPSA